MSQYLRCDICDKSSKVWQFRSKFNIFRWFQTIEGANKEEMDVCDNCIDRIRKEISRESA